jgi:hypothetical protein
MSSTAEANQLPIGGRALLVWAGLDLHVFDTEIKRIEREATNDQEEAA